MAVLGAVASVALAALLVVAAWSGPLLAAAAVAVSVLALASGWGSLLDLPDERGTAVVVLLTGSAALAAVAAGFDARRPLAVFAAVVAAAVLLAFAHELLRGGGRADLVESVTGTLSGQVVAVLGAGWVLLPSTGLGVAGVVPAAAAVVAARLATALPGAASAWAGLVLGAVAAGVAARQVTPDHVVAGAVTGLCVAAVVVGLDRLLSAQDAARGTAGLVAAAAAPVTAAGTVAYAVARLLVP